MNIPIVYEDDWLLVVDKPSGLLTIPTPKNESRTLTSILNDDVKQRGLSYRLHPCHRLDRETSGLIIYAKGKSVQKKLMEDFRNRRVKKTYIAFVQGQLPQSQGRITNPIEGESAFTNYRVIQGKKEFTVVEVMPETGRTNQIRLHFKHAGHPVVGERKFAFRKDFKLKAKRLHLHAQELVFRHPATGKDVQLKVELPKDMAGFLAGHK